jgi:hypothetical protein
VTTVVKMAWYKGYEIHVVLHRNQFPYVFFGHTFEVWQGSRHIYTSGGIYKYYLTPTAAIRAAKSFINAL